MNHFQRPRDSDVFAHAWNTMEQWRRRDADLDEEIRAHLSMVEHRVERGESPKDAALAAHREFGNRLLVKKPSVECGVGPRWNGPFRI